MAKIVQSYRDLVVWNKAMQLVTEIYRVSQNFPKDELFGLMSQIRRAAVSVPSNIAEGHGKLSRKEYQHFLGHARGSLAEVETQMMIAQNLGYLNAEVVSRMLDLSGEVGRILNGLLASLKSKE
ncbi:MAG: four helix bundle protein [Pseudomonadota bacterium]